MKIVNARRRCFYGTDFPFRDGPRKNGGLSRSVSRRRIFRAIERDNALKLLPALKNVISATVRIRRL